MTQKYNVDYFVNLAKSDVKNKPTLLITCPYETYSLISLHKCLQLGLINVILVGEEHKINDTINKANITFSDDVKIVNASNDQEAADKSMQLLKEKQATILMKGLIDTSVLLKTLLNRDYELRTDKLMTHCCLSCNPNYDRYFIVSDPAMIIKPTLEQKVKIIENAVFLARALGIKKPLVANLTAKEKPYEKMPCTLEAAKLQEMNQNNEIKDCIVSGPLQIDLALDSESAQIKGCKDPVAGKANILICPDIESANILTKGLVYLGGWSFAGLILGAKVPIVLTSRSTNEDDRIISICLACICDKYQR